VGVNRFLFVSFFKKMYNFNMLKKRYLEKIKSEAKQFAKKNKGVKIFIFGSSLLRKDFGDVDLGISGKVNYRAIAELKENFSASTIPYFIDIVNFNKVSKEFKENVFREKVLWIKH
jgi:predicted nucleotidyltransferase